MFKWAFGVFIALFLGFGTFVFFRTGFYKDVTISSGNHGPFLFVYREHMGPYHKIVPTLEKVETEVKAMGMPCERTFGRFHDDPKIVPHDRLRADTGCVLAPNIPADSFKEKGFLTETVDMQNYLMATFNGSPSVGPFRVYPKVEKWCAKYGFQLTSPVLELYKVLPDRSVLTTYLFQYK